MFIGGYATMELVETLAGKPVALFTSALVFVLCIIALASPKEANRG